MVSAGATNQLQGQEPGVALTGSHNVIGRQSQRLRVLIWSESQTEAVSTAKLLESNARFDVGVLWLGREVSTAEFSVGNWDATVVCVLSPEHLPMLIMTNFFGTAFGKVVAIIDIPDFAVHLHPLQYNVTAILSKRNLTSRRLSATLVASVEGEVKILEGEFLRRSADHHCRTQSEVSESARQSLSKRQQQILTLLAQGQSQKEIAGALRISERTVHTHVARLRQKLGARSTYQLAQHLPNTPAYDFRSQRSV